MTSRAHQSPSALAHVSAVDPEEEKSGEYLPSFHLNLLVQVSKQSRGLQQPSQSHSSTSLDLQNFPSAAPPPSTMYHKGVGGLFTSLTHALCRAASCCVSIQG